MISSGIKRTLAVTAISALAVTGIPALAGSASATSNNEQATVLDLLNPGGIPVSVRNDGTDTTVSLEAVAPAAVTGEVTFQYQVTGTTAWVDIASVARNDDGAFSTEWDASPVAGSKVTIRVFAGPVASPTAQDKAVNVEVRGDDDTTSVIHLTTASGLGVFRQPYASATDTDQQNKQNVIITGTGVGAGANLGQALPNGGYKYATNVTYDSPRADGATADAFSAIVDITGYEFGGDADEIVFAGGGTDTQDFESYTLYNQEVATITAAVDKTTVPAGGTSAVVTVTVKDQNRKPVAGAQVFRSDGAGDAKYTDKYGQATFSQDIGTFYYYANSTDSTPFEGGLDPRTNDVDVTAPGVDPVELKAVLHATNRGKIDKLRVSTRPDAVHTKVKFFKMKDGQLKRIATGRTGRLGNSTKKVKDRNGNKFTAYYAIVTSTPTTKSDKTNRSKTR